MQTADRCLASSPLPLKPSVVSGSCSRRLGRPKAQPLDACLAFALAGRIHTPCFAILAHQRRLDPIDSFHGEPLQLMRRLDPYLAWEG